MSKFDTPKEWKNEYLGQYISRDRYNLAPLLTDCLPKGVKAVAVERNNNHERRTETWLVELDVDPSAVVACENYQGSAANIDRDQKIAELQHQLDNQQSNHGEFLRVCEELEGAKERLRMHDENRRRGERWLNSATAAMRFARGKHKEAHNCKALHCEITNVRTSGIPDTMAVEFACFTVYQVTGEDLRTAESKHASEQRDAEYWRGEVTAQDTHNKRLDKANERLHTENAELEAKVEELTRKLADAPHVIVCDPVCPDHAHDWSHGKCSVCHVRMPDGQAPVSHLDGIKDLTRQPVAVFIDADAPDDLMPDGFPQACIGVIRPK